MFDDVDSVGILSLFQDSFPNYQGHYLGVITQWPNNCWFVLKDDCFFSFNDDFTELLSTNNEHLQGKPFNIVFSNLILSADPIDEYLQLAGEGKPQLFYANFEFEDHANNTDCYEIFLFHYSMFAGERLLIGGLRKKGELCDSHFSSFPEFEKQIYKALNAGIWSWEPATNAFTANKIVHETYNKIWPIENRKQPFWQQPGELSLFRLRQKVEQANEEEADFEFDYLLPTASGVKHISEKGHFSMHNGKRVMLGISQDITGANQLITKAKQAWMVFENTREAIMVTDSNGLIVDINPAAEKLMGYSLQELENHTPKIFKSGIQDQQFYQDMWNTLIETGVWEGDIWNRKKDGTLIPLKQSINAINNLNGERFYVSIFHDISKRKEQEKLLQQQIYTDKLTGLANREKLNFELDQLLAESEEQQAQLAVLFIDLDGFKRINDSFGHQIGDVALIEAANRMLHALPEKSLLGRQGGDEFIAALIFNDIDELDGYIQSLLTSFKTAFKVSELELYLSASIGVSLSPTHSSSRSELIKFSDTAMYVSKDSGKNQVTYYNSRLTEKVQRLLSVEFELRKVLKLHSLEFHYQPIIDLSLHDRELAISGYEVLARWPSQHKLNASTVELIESAEHSGLIVKLTAQLLATTVNKLKQLPKHDLCTFSINVSSEDLLSANFASDFLEAFKGNENLLPNIQVEVTETSLLQDCDYAAQQLRELKLQGVKIAIDDFGVGYSSFARLHSLPIDVLKIDRSFVSEVNVSAEKRDMLNALLVLAHALNLKVVVEGVETEQEHKVVSELGCDFAQGYYYGKPEAELLKQELH